MSKKRLWGLSLRVLVGVPVAIAAGSLMLLFSYCLHDRVGWEWVTDALLNVGSSILLFAPLLLLSEWILSRRVNQLESEVRQTQTEVGDAQIRLAEVIDYRDQGQREDASADLDTEIRERLFGPIREQDEKFAALVTARDPAVFVETLSVATAAYLITSAGPRVELMFSDLHVRFSVEGDALKLQLESGAGKVHGLAYCQPGEDVLDGLTAISAHASKVPGFDGMDKLFPGQTPRQLSDLLLFASKYRYTITGERKLEHLVEITEAGWVLTETALLPKSVPYYEIAADRFDEIDWPEHIVNKGWPESYAFPATLEWARKLLDVPTRLKRRGPTPLPPTTEAG